MIFRCWCNPPALRASPFFKRGIERDSRYRQFLFAVDALKNRHQPSCQKCAEDGDERAIGRCQQGKRVGERLIHRREYAGHMQRDVHQCGDDDEQHAGDYGSDEFFHAMFLINLNRVDYSNINGLRIVCFMRFW